MSDEPLSNKRIHVPLKEFIQSPVRPIKSTKHKQGKAKVKGGGEERRKADTPTQSQSSNHQDVERDTQINDQLPWSQSPTPTRLQTQTMPPPPTPSILIDPSLPTFERGTSQIPLRSIKMTPAPPAPPAPPPC